MELNKIYNIDCLEFMKNMESKSVDLILTDPPYLYLNHKLDRPFNEELFFSECFRILKDESVLCFFGRGASFYKWGYLCQQLGFEFLEEMIWDKNCGTSPFGNVMRVHETTSVWRKGKKQLNKIHVDKIEYEMNAEMLETLFGNLKRLFSDLNMLKTGQDFENWYNRRKLYGQKHKITVSSLTETPNPIASILKGYQNGKVLSSIMRVSREHHTMEHPTQKPLELIRILTELCSNQNDVIFDPFLGSGTTAIAAINTNRQYIGCEIDKEYFEIATKRIENAKKINKSKLF